METSELLVETLKQLNLEEFGKFRTLAEAKLSLVTSSSLEAANVQDVVDVMVKSSSAGCVEAVRTVLMKMDRLDLVQRLSATDSGAKDKLSVDEERLSLDQRIEKLSRDFNLLLETLKHLSDVEVQDFKRHLRVRSSRSRPRYSLQEQPIWMESKDLQDVVIFIIQTHRKKSLMVTRDVLEGIRREDLVQRLSSSSASREMPLGKQPALIHKVATMTAVKDVLLETLDDLNEPEFNELKLLLQFTNFQRNIPLLSWNGLYSADRTRMVDLLVDKCGKQSVEVIREVLLDLNRTDLVLRLPETSSSSKEKLSMKLNSAFLQKVEKLEFVTELLLETLEELHEKEIRKFLEITESKIDHLSGYMLFYHFPNVRYIVVGLVLTYFHQSVEKTMDALKEMKKDDLITKLSDRSSGLKEKPSAGQHGSALIHKVATMAAVRQQLLETLDKLTQEEFMEKFKDSLSEFSIRLEFTTKKAEYIDEMMMKFGQQSMKMIKDLLIKVNRKDLAENLQETGIPMDLRLKHAETVNSQKDSSSWTKVEPEMKTADPDEAPAYSLQSEAGHFECSVSGLRWFCSERVVFRYRFCSWFGHMERMESRGYRPAGPLLDISLITGRMAEVFLPHWICVDDVPEPLEQFAVLHMDDCGDVVEKVSEVSPSHVKLTEPIFSPRAVLMRVGIPMKVFCNMLLYRTNTAFLTLHVYLIPRDPALQQEMDQREKSYGYKVIRKPDPDRPLKMSEYFVLTADLKTAEVCPERLKLRYDPKRPNFFEVYIKNADTDFQMKLSKAKQPNPVWSCTLRKDEYHKTEDREGGSTGVTYSHSAASLRSDREKLLEVIENLNQQELKRFRFFLKDVEAFGCGADGGAAPLSITAGQLENADALDLVDLMLQTFSQQAVEKTKEVLRKIPRNDLLEALSGSGS
ncbi:uncharacterized protein LOC122831280 isoform X3 [Gambusia affinis]|uniref:uncharacterized protein LOC122831280 isoform X3 n=1 Tax=Gambusia affinis TaxID=33528 RepID=UPI001CDC50A2|nr:uncharacterized protein LOC122831280 isoform X3 [Gambusia affinis]